jgi:hypothetical protein
MQRTLAAAFVVLLATSCGDDSPNLESAQWFVTGTRSQSTLIVRVAIGSSSCNELESIEAVETDDTITLRPLVNVEVGPGDCTADDMSKDFDVPLDAPWGARKITGCRKEASLRIEFPGDEGCAFF